MIKPGIVALVKTTEEPVFILSRRTETDHDLGPSYLVKRPVATEKGIQHVFEDFFAAELETTEERTERTARESAQMRARLRAEIDADSPGKDSVHKFPLLTN